MNIPFQKALNRKKLIKEPLYKRRSEIVHMTPILSSHDGNLNARGTVSHLRASFKHRGDHFKGSCWNGNTTLAVRMCFIFFLQTWKTTYHGFSCLSSEVLKRGKRNLLT